MSTPEPPAAAGADVPPISVVIPTYQRREIVGGCVRALQRQAGAGDFEVVVVVDGSTDGTADALRCMRPPFPLRVVEQPNRGLPAARNAGAVAARGRILLFMDDDMEAAPALLAEHLASHGDGAGIVVGPNPVHADSAPGLLTDWVQRWVDRRTVKYSAAGAVVPVSEISGRFSVPREAFEAVGGFDTQLRRGGDVDFAYRVMNRGYRPVFNSNAVSCQRYVITARQFLHQWRSSGRADVVSVRKHPEIARYIFSRSLMRRRYMLAARVPLLTAPLRAVAILLVQQGFRGAFVDRLFSWVQAAEYCRGVLEAGGPPGGSLRAKPRRSPRLGTHGAPAEPPTRSIRNAPHR